MFAREPLTPGEILYTEIPYFPLEKTARYTRLPRPAAIKRAIIDTQAKSQRMNHGHSRPGRSHLTYLSITSLTYGSGDQTARVACGSGPRLVAGQKTVVTC